MPGRPSGADKKQGPKKEGSGMQKQQRGGNARVCLGSNSGGGLGHRTLIRSLANASAVFNKPQTI